MRRCRTEKATPDLLLGFLPVPSRSQSPRSRVFRACMYPCAMSEVPLQSPRHIGLIQHLIYLTPAWAPFKYEVDSFPGSFP